MPGGRRGTDQSFSEQCRTEEQVEDPGDWEGLLTGAGVPEGAEGGSMWGRPTLCRGKH